VKLSIIIPTYTRPEAITRRVRELLPFLGEELELVIIDNASPQNVEELIASEVPESVGRIRHIRNRVNIGGNANICRCFEVGNGDWMWLLGDDDDVLGSAVSSIMEEIDKVALSGLIVAGFNFSTSIYEYPVRVEFVDIHSYWRSLKGVNQFGNALFISSCVYNLGEIRQWLKMGYQYCYSCAPQMVMVMCALSNGLVWINSPAKLVHCEEPLPEEKWNSFVVLSGLPSLMDVPGCAAAVIDNIGPGLDPVLWRPFLVGGLGMIFFGTSRGSKYWLMQFERLRHLLVGRSKVKAAFLEVVAKLCYYLPPFRVLGRLCFKLMNLRPPEIDGGFERF
jgi:hypothetical protein